MTTIRPITLDDVPSYHAALASVAREGLYLRMTEAPSLASTSHFVADNIGNGNPHFVALDGHVVVGWCDICRSGEHRSEHVGSLGMGVIASHRRRGIGHKLIAATLAAALPLFRRVELEVYATNPGAIALYERVGFVPEGTRRRAIHIEGVDIDIVMMGLLRA